MGTFLILSIDGKKSAQWKYFDNNTNAAQGPSVEDRESPFRHTARTAGQTADGRTWMPWEKHGVK